MGGAAAVLGAADALSRSKPPTPGRVHVIVAACENMVDGKGMRPGDILTTAAGKTIEVNNTDAEGRLTLADALWYAQHKANAAAVVDVATLTGACMVALGSGVAGLMASEDAAAEAVAAAARKAGEKVWRLPLEESYFEQLKSPVSWCFCFGNGGGGWWTSEGRGRRGVRGPRHFEEKKKLIEGEGVEENKSKGYKKKSSLSKSKTEIHSKQKKTLILGRRHEKLRGPIRRRDHRRALPEAVYRGGTRKRERKKRERSFFFPCPSPPGLFFSSSFFFFSSRSFFFLSSFNSARHQQGVEWAHIDIAGPAWSDGEGGATGFGVATLAQWASEAGARAGASSSDE